MPDAAHPSTWRTLLAFGIIYFVWGSTFLAIRIGVLEFPPFLMAGLRFLIAGAVMYGWAIARGQKMPARQQWMAILVLAIFFFLLDYGLVFWAERRVPSGVTAVMLAMIPAYIALFEIMFLRTQKLTLRLTLALAAGVAGVAVLVSRSLSLGGAPINTAGAIALIFAPMTWAIGTILTRKFSLPTSKEMSSGSQMLTGGILLLLASASLGEFHGFHFSAVSREAWFALLYLIVAGSIMGFTAYIWLLDHESPTKVGTYAYVNPVLAVFLGYFLAGETLGIRTILGTLLVLTSVIAITTAKARKSVVAASMKDTAKASG